MLMVWEFRIWRTNSRTRLLALYFAPRVCGVCLTEITHPGHGGERVLIVPHLMNSVCLNPHSEHCAANRIRAVLPAGQRAEKNMQITPWEVKTTANDEARLQERWGEKWGEKNKLQALTCARELDRTRQKKEVFNKLIQGLLNLKRGTVWQSPDHTRGKQRFPYEDIW